MILLVLAVAASSDERQCITKDIASLFRRERERYLPSVRVVYG